MNKKVIGNLFILIIIMAVCILPYNVFAEQYSKNEAKKTCGTTKPGWETACGNNYGITITTTAYKRTANYNNGVYTNSVSPRTITISAKSNKKYKIRIYYADVGTLKKLSLDDWDDGEDDNDGVDLIKKAKTDLKTTPYTWNLPAGKEALVVAYLADEQDSGKKCTTGNGNKKTVNCKKGSYDIVDGEVELKGTAASLFVENPTDTGLVKNLRREDGAYGEACDAAEKGKYVGSAADVKKYSVNGNPTLQKYYQDHYYRPVLGDNYCSKEYVAFNLREENINKVSNKLLKTYYKSRKLEEKISNSSSSSSTNSTSSVITMEQLNNEIESIKSKNPNIKIYYGQNGDKPDLDISCNARATTTEAQDFLYITAPDAIKTQPLSDGSTPTVCDVKCYEHLKVSYSPPVASKAAICFTYKLTVRSETNCGVKYYKDVIEGTVDQNGNMTNKGVVAKSAKDMCAPVPICSNDKQKTQAGPAEEFDQCVKECDGGKYSQQCINKCYDKVYGKDDTNNNKTENKTTTKKTTNNTRNTTGTVNLLDLKENSSSAIVNVAKYSESDLKKYYKENNPEGCSTANLKKWVTNNATKFDNCAEYFFKAKTLYPMGKYKFTSSGDITWKPNSSITNAGATNKDVTNIPMQIGRAAPFYIRDKASTKALLKDLLGATKGLDYKYNIGAKGIKRQYNHRWVCHESCTYTGCERKDALTPKDFVSGLVALDEVSEGGDDTADGYASQDLDKIESALEKCIATAECKTQEEGKSEFTINIENDRLKENTTIDVNGQTSMGQTHNESTVVTSSSSSANSCTPSADDKFSMFVPANKVGSPLMGDDIIDPEDVGTEGILGLCYDGRKNPHYKTTITFPGSWINFKTGEVFYDKPCEGSTLEKEQYCTAYDSTDINQKWWNYRINGAPYADPEINDNIKATAKSFGKYKWNIKFKCFYAISSTAVPCPDGICSDDQNGCPDGDLKCSASTCTGENCTGASNIDIRFVREDSKLFANRTYGATGKSTDANNQIGFNWTSDAQDKTLTTNARGYDINPYEYGKSIMDENNTQKVYQTTPDVVITLTPNDFRTVKSYTNQISQFKGKFTAIDEANLPGLYAYKSDVLRSLGGIVQLKYQTSRHNYE